MNRILFSSGSDEWSTPQDIFDKLNAEFRFTLDPCATDENHKCDKWFTKEEDGLQKSWGGGERILQSSLRERTSEVGS